MEKTLSFTYDEAKTPASNVLEFFKNIYEKYDLVYYDVIEFTINKITYNCSCGFAMEELNKKFKPHYYYYKIIKNEPSKN